MIFGFWFHLRKRTFKSMLHEIYASSISCLSNSRATVRGCGSGVMVRRQLVKLALLIKLLLDTPVRGEYSPAVFVIFVIGAYSDSPGPGLRVKPPLRPW